MSAEEKSFPFDSVMDENGQDDRLYYAEDFANYFTNFIGNGIYPNPSDCLQVMANNGFALTVKKGSGFINGYGYILTEDLDIRLNVSVAAYSRKDVVVLRLDLINRQIKIYCIEGEPSSSIETPEIIRNSDIYDLKLAEVTVKAGTNSISQSNILDTRLDNSVCGVVSSVVESVDTETLFIQYDQYLKEKMAEWDNTKQEQENEFTNKMLDIETWYTSVKLDITKLQSFNFDNLAELTGTTKKTNFLSNGNIEEKIYTTLDNTKVAERTTTFLSNGNIEINVVVYEINGIDIMKSASILTKFNSDGTITEEVN